VFDKIIDEGGQIGEAVTAITHGQTQPLPQTLPQRKIDPQQVGPSEQELRFFPFKQHVVHPFCPYQRKLAKQDALQSSHPERDS
jgi:hypothetical protein